MNDHYAKNQKLREENVELANKLKSLIEQYELREKVMTSANAFLCIFTLKCETFRLRPITFSPVLLIDIFSDS